MDQMCLYLTNPYNPLVKIVTRTLNLCDRYTEVFERFEIVSCVIPEQGFWSQK